MTFPVFLCISSAFIQIILSAIVFAKAPGKAENRLFSLQLFLFFLWSLAELNLIHFGINDLSIKLLFTPGFLLAYCFCIFTAIYPEHQPDAVIIKNKRNPWLFLIPAIALLYLLWNGNLISSFENLKSGFSLNFGKFEFLIKGVLVGYLFLSLSTLSKSRKRAETKSQIRRLRYTFTAMLLPVAAGSIIIAFSKWFIGGLTVYTFGLFPVLNIIMSLILSYTMLKYNLMEIDLIFSIGLVYTLLTAILAGIMELFQELMQEILSFSDLWAKLISVLIIAAVFSPLKDLLIKLVDRFFGRQSFDSAKVMQFILSELRKLPEQQKLFKRLNSELHLVLDHSFAAIYCNGLLISGSPEPFAKELPYAEFKSLPEEMNDLEVIIHHFGTTADSESEKKARLLKDQEIRHYFAIKNGSDFFGSLVLGPKNTKVPYTATELNLVSGLVAEVPHILENLQMINKLLAQEKITQEIQWASKLLHAIAAPAETSAFFNLDLATYSSLSSEIKGDMIDICAHKDNAFIGIYDAFHQGIQAVLTLNVVFGVFRCFPDALTKIQQLNSILRNYSQQLCCAVTTVHQSSSSLQLVNSGNPSPLILAKGKAQPVFIAITEPAGLRESLAPASCELDLQDDEFLFISTNGLYKAFSQLHGIELTTFLAENSFSDVNSVRREILQAIEPITRKNYSDDITFIVAGIKK